VDTNTKKPKVIWNPTTATGCKMLSGKISDKTIYNDVLTVRNQTDPRWPDQTTEEDNYSDHYCMYVENLPVGSLGVTRALDGELFMQEFCPPQILEDFHEVLVAAYRFRILDAYRQTSSRVPGISLSRHMVREAWREQISRGAALDIINIESTHVRLYQRMGYVLCEGYNSMDPELGTPSCIMLLPVDPARKSFISDIIKDADVTVSLNDVMRSLTKTNVYMSDHG